MGLNKNQKNILYQVDKNARLSNSQIGRLVGLGKESVRSTLQKLEAQEYILGYHPFVDLSRLGGHTYRVYVKLHNATPSQEEEIKTFLQSHIGCNTIASLEGEYDYVFTLSFLSLKELYDFLKVFKAQFSNYLFDLALHHVYVMKRYPKQFLIGRLGKEVYINDLSETYNETIDNLDGLIIRQLSINARMNVSDIALHLNTTPRKVMYRMKRLHKKGILKGYFTSLDYFKLGYNYHEIIVSVRNADIIAIIQQFFAQQGTVLFVNELIGKFDLSIELVSLGMDDFRSLLKRFKKLFIDQINFYQVHTVLTNSFEGFSLSNYLTSEEKEEIEQDKK